MPNARVRTLGSAIPIFYAGDGGGDILDVDVVARATGGFAVAHTDYSSGGAFGAVRTRSYSATGDPLNSDQTVASRVQPGWLSDAAAVAFPNGGLTVFYSAPAPGFSSTDVFERRYDSAGVPGSVVTIANQFRFENKVEAALLASGKQVVVWADDTSSGTPGDKITYRLIDVDGTPLGTAATAGPATTDGALHPAVAALGDGGFVIVWQDRSGAGTASTDYVIRAQRFDAAGAAVGGDFVVNQSTAGTQHDPSVAALPSGGYVVTWVTSPDGTSGQGNEMARIFGPGAPGDEFLVGNADSGTANSSQHVATLPQGGFVIVWQSQAGIYAEDGTPMGDPFQAVNGVSSVASLADGSIVFVSGTEGNPVHGGSVTAQRFEWITDYAGTAGNDDLGGSLIDDTFTPGAGVDFVRGFAGHDLVDYSNLTHAMEINLTAGWSWDGSSMDFLREIEDATGSSGNDYLTGTTGDNILDGGPGGTDFINGLGGTDTVSYASATQSVQIYLADQNSWDGATMDFLSSMENATGSAFDDYIVGDGGDNVLDGGPGGTDFLIGGAGQDTVSYMSSLLAVQVYLDTQGTWDGVTMDFLDSIDGAIGSQFADTLVAGSGGGRLEGWRGDDSLYGGAGSDVFEFTGLDSSFNLGNDRIFGFEHGVDKIAIGGGLGPVDSFSDLLDHAAQVGADTVITLNDLTSIRIVGVDLSTLTAGDFLFVT